MDKDTAIALLKTWTEQELATTVDYALSVQNLGDEMGHAYAWRDGVFKYARIEIDTAVARTPLMWRGVLWHEFCHVWDYFRTGSMGHYDKWIKRWLSRPQYVVAMIIVFPIYLYNLAKKG